MAFFLLYRLFLLAKTFNFDAIPTANMEYSFSPEEIAAIKRHIAKYPDRKSAVMPALWIAREKFGWLSDEAMSSSPKPSSTCLSARSTV
ncbi:MAG: NAD(P)H-dependent oxidoreductase subunit E [Bacteroidia bacterium]